MPQLLPGDNPQAYIPGDRRRSLARGEDLPTVTHGSGVFVDISGFTKLTEALVRELGGRRGAEVLSANIDRIFAALMEPLHHHGGSVIYFSGDAVTAWIDRDDGSRATACALAMQRGDGRGRRRRDAGRRAGHARGQGRGGRGAGAPLRGRRPACPAHRRAGGGADGLARGRGAAVAARRGRPRRGRPGLARRPGRARGDARRRASDRSASSRPWPIRPLADRGGDWPRLPEEIARKWVLPPVWDRMVVGRGEFLAELRPAVPIFVKFGGLDFDEDPAAPCDPRRLRDAGTAAHSTSRAARSSS